MLKRLMSMVLIAAIALMTAACGGGGSDTAKKDGKVDRSACQTELLADQLTGDIPFAGLQYGQNEMTGHVVLLFFRVDGVPERSLL